MEKLIPIINKLQDVFNAVGSAGIDLPQIVVVGSQSSGKSSVLESVVGRDFLPRGSGIVTRRPLILQLINLPWEGKAQDNSLEEWGEFLHLPNRPFYDFNQIKEEIQAETDKVTGTNKGVSSVPINLKIYSPNVLNLTLVDLPGITHVAVGDQPKDIDRQIREMIFEFINKPNTIILAVTPGNLDLANSDSLQIAKEVDPQGERTLGVITKLDLMDKGTDAMDILNGEVYPLKLGFIGVVNRSQQDIIEKKNIRESLNNETKYFQSHPLYKKIAHKLGTTFLAQTLNRLLLQHIRDCLPELKVKITKMLVEAEKEAQSYGDLYEDHPSKGALLLSVLTKFSNDYKAAIEGKLTDSSARELYGGARINYIFNETYTKCLQTMSSLDGLDINDIRTAIRNATGPRTALFVPEASFELLTKRQVSRFLQPSLQCVDMVFEELLRIVAQLENKELIRFYLLKERVLDVVTELLNECRIPTRELISNLINIELAFVNTGNPDFVGASGAINLIVNSIVEEKMAIREREFQAQQREATLKAAQEAEAAQGHGQKNLKNAANQVKYARAAMSATASKVAQKSSNAFNNVLKAKSKKITLDNVPQTIRAEGALTDREQKETEAIKTLLDSYFKIVRKNTQDTVPKSIMLFLVNRSKETIHNRLVEKLYKEDMIDELLGESPEIAARRKNTKEMVIMLKRATEILNEVRDFNLK